MKAKTISKWIVAFAIAIGVGAFGLQTVSAASGSAEVSFTQGQTLNPSNPRLPLADTSGDGGSTVATTGESKPNVVVDTTPEKSDTTKKVTTTKKTTTNRRTLPQTGSVEVPALMALMTTLFGLVIVREFFKRGLVASK